MDIKRSVLNTSKIVTAGTVATVGGNWKTAVAAAIGESLSIGLDRTFADMSQERAVKLFGNAELVARVVDEVKKSDDFASFVLDLWREYNLESSEYRRQLLKSILEKSAYEEERKYENFSKMLLITQQITSTELIILKVFYSSDTPNYSAASSGSSIEDFQINNQELQKLLSEKHMRDDSPQEISESLTQLGNYGLISERQSTWGGPYYAPLQFGRIFLGYLES